MRAVELLGDLTHDLRARRVGQPRELAQMLFERLARTGPLERRTHEERPLERRGNGDQVAGDGEGPGCGWE
jgi:hypothetical protein